MATYLDLCFAGLTPLYYLPRDTDNRRRTWTYYYEDTDNITWPADWKRIPYCSYLGTTSGRLGPSYQPGVKFPSDGVGLVNTTDLTTSSTVFTVGFWCRIDEDPGGWGWRALYFNGPWEGANWWIGILEGTLEFYCYRNSNDTEGYLDVAGALPVGEWHHLGMVTNGSNHRCFLDGQFVGEFTLTLDAPSATVYEILGSGTDEVGRWSASQFQRFSTALSDADMALLPWQYYMHGADVILAALPRETIYRYLRGDKIATGVDEYTSRHHDMTPTGAIVAISDGPTFATDAPEAWVNVMRDADPAVPWNDPSYWTTNGKRTRMYAEAQILFHESYLNGNFYNYHQIFNTGSLAGSSWGYLEVQLAANTDANWNPSPGNHTFFVESYCDGFTSYEVISPAGTYTTAQLENGGQPLTVRLEWKPSTVTSTEAQFTDAGSFDTAADGELTLKVGGVTTFNTTTAHVALSEMDDWARLNTLATLTISCFAGEYLCIRVGTIEWVDVAEFVRTILWPELFTHGVAVVQIHLWSSSPTANVQARLYDHTNGVSVGESEVVCSTVPVRQKFNATPSPRRAEYTLQVTADETDAAIFAIGYIRGYYWGTPEPLPVPPPPPAPSPLCPAWWLPYDASLGYPESKGASHKDGAGSISHYWWVGITAITATGEGPLAFAGDWHGQLPPAGTIAGHICWRGVPGAMAYRVYMFNCYQAPGGVRGDLFDPHLRNTELVASLDFEPPPLAVAVRFKDIPASPENFGGWPSENNEGPWGPENPAPQYECVFYSDLDGTEWTLCCSGQ
jgi:hypothetical protein